MNDTTHLASAVTSQVDLKSLSAEWLKRFEALLCAGDTTALASLFAPECHYRDILAFSWTLRPSTGAQAIAEFLTKAQKKIQAKSFCLASERAAPRKVRRVGIEVIEAIFKPRRKNRWQQTKRGCLFKKLWRCQLARSTHTRTRF